MECPHCDYKNEWGWWDTGLGEKYFKVDGMFGDFYKQHDPFVRQTEPLKSEFITAFACPCCYKTFVSQE